MRNTYLHYMTLWTKKFKHLERQVGENKDYLGDLYQTANEKISKLDETMDNKIRDLENMDNKIKRQAVQTKNHIAELDNKSKQCFIDIKNVTETTSRMSRDINTNENKITTNT